MPSVAVWYWAVVIGKSEFIVPPLLSSWAKLNWIENCLVVQPVKQQLLVVVVFVVPFSVFVFLSCFSHLRQLQLHIYILFRISISRISFFSLVRLWYGGCLLTSHKPLLKKKKNFTQGSTQHAPALRTVWCLVSGAGAGKQVVAVDLKHIMRNFYQWNALYVCSI